MVPTNSLQGNKDYKHTKEKRGEAQFVDLETLLRRRSTGASGSIEDNQLRWKNMPSSTPEQLLASITRPIHLRRGTPAPSPWLGGRRTVGRWTHSHRAWPRTDERDITGGSEHGGSLETGSKGRPIAKAHRITAEEKKAADFGR